jgi:hypothetical protein
MRGQGSTLAQPLSYSLFIKKTWVVGDLQLDKLLTTS